MMQGATAFGTAMRLAAVGVFGLAMACERGAATDKTGAGTKLRTIEVPGGQQRYFVDFLDQGGGARHIIVRSAGYREFDRSEGDVAFAAATQAGTEIDCGNGAPVQVLADTATFIEASRSVGALARGQAHWQFKGRCGG